MVERVSSCGFVQPGDHYLWFSDMEWCPVDKLRGFKFMNDAKDRFVPFAESAGGDYWCWYPTMESKGAAPVLLCLHDCYDADLYAPDFAAALYRHALQYAAEILDDYHSDRRRAMLKRCAVDLHDLWPDSWTHRIEQVAACPIDWSEYKATIAAEFGDYYVGYGQVRWRKEM